MLVDLQGQIERITCINEENGFTIARVKVYGQRDMVTIVENVIYTAVTRGRKLVVMVGTRKALAIGVKNDRTQKRCRYLRHRLR